jgi:hypothetical protein
MNPNQRFTLLTFPQFFDGTVLRLNVVFMPRNQNPLMPAIEGQAPSIPDAPAFADAKLSFVARIVSGLSGLPGATAPRPPIALVTTQPAMVRPLFDALANQFTIINKGAANTNLNINAVAQAAPLPLKLDASVKKYLPLSYRESFNFVAPRSKNAVIDDAYHCAIRDAGPNPGFVRSPDDINWGQVFASAMRQPQLAQALGIIYHTELAIDGSYFPKGGWLYVDLADASDYKAQQSADATFVKRYAARIPALATGKSRSVFGAIQFPVLPVAPPGNYDTIFIEAAEFDDGFAKVIHAFQPVSHNLLLEKSDGFHPTKEVGIRLGWDDEQILIWYIRQLAEESSGSMRRIDAPIGVLGYKIDVREKASPPGPWQSLNTVNSKAPLTVVNPATQQAISIGNFTSKELPYQVYPSQIDGDSAKPYWLPMYFAAWSGKSMVLPDDVAAEIYRNDEVIAKPPINVKPGLANNLNKIYEPAAIATTLRYSGLYEFRVRLGDISGGGPGVDREPAGNVPTTLAECRFKRFVAPNAVKIDGLPENSDSTLFAGNELTIHRPILGYPAVVFTQKYADPVTLLKEASKDAKYNYEAFGIPDPDVDSVEITVELQTLKMDNIMSVSGRESYIRFYTTTRKFPKLSPVFDDELRVPLRYVDCRVLNFGDTGDLGDLGVNQSQIDAMDDLVLPTARTIRLTVRGVCEAKADYYGSENPDPALNTRYGRTLQFQLYADAKQNDPAQDDSNLASQAQIRAIYLQPDPPFVFDGNIGNLLLGREVEKTPDMIQRLAQQLGLDNDKLSLVGKKGQRVQFGCSNRIRHTLSPDNSSITFASKGDLAHHWLCCITLELERDWTWDGLQDRSFVLQRTARFKEDDVATDTDTMEVGDIEIKRTAPLTSLLNPDRSRTTLVFIDAVEPKNNRHRPAPDDNETRFPDLIELKYTLRPQLKKPVGFPIDVHLPDLELPITLPPAQVPRVVSAGIALSPYVRNQRYSETEPRRRFLWIEFAEPVRDPKDTYFARVLAYAPDQLISNNSPELLVVPEEPSLPVDSESIRVVSPMQPNDNAGLDAMQPMEKSTDSDLYYLLPLPPGLHPESAEMFGFFSYELRVGHFRYTDTTEQHNTGDDVWTTAQGRFGRALKVHGIQHPAPTLTCTVNRDEEKVYVSAPYAVAVYQGRNVTADPPRTEIWALLYAQVKQADNKDFRNILLDDRSLNANVRVEHDKLVNWNAVYTVQQRNTLKRAVMMNVRDDVAYTGVRQMYKLVDNTVVNKDATKYGTAIWSNSEVTQMLALYGLPPDAPLSVLCVEVLPHIRNVYDHVSDLHRKDVRDKLRAAVGSGHFPADGVIMEGLARRASATQSVNLAEDRPLSDQLGEFRILRSSPLMEVAFVCCTQC